MSEEQWEEPFHRANKLIGERRVAEAREVLKSAKAAALQAKKDRTAAFYSSALGSLWASDGENERALAEYAEAESLQPDEISHPLRTARLLLDSMNRADDALLRIERVLPRLKSDDSVREETRATLTRLIAAAGSEETKRRARAIYEELAA